jgi:hypothetical protein
MEKYLIFIIIGVIIYTLLTCEKKRVEVGPKVKEGFSAQLNDMEAIRTLAMAARDLQAGGLNVKGNLSVTDNLNLVNGKLSMNSKEIRLRGPGDGNHYLQVDRGIDGPTLAGFRGGILGTTEGGEKHILSWHNDRTVNINGTTNVNNNITIGKKDANEWGGRLTLVGGTKESPHINFMPNSGERHSFLISRPDGLVTSADLDVKRNLNVSGNLCIGGTCITETELKKLKSHLPIAGYAVDGGGSTHLLFEGSHRFEGSNEPFGWFNNAMNESQVFKGWRVTFWDGNFTGTSWVNDNSGGNSVPVRVDRQHQDRAGSYKAEWIGY